MFGCLCMYGQLLVLVIQPCFFSSPSDVHVPNLYLHIDEQNKGWLNEWKEEISLKHKNINRKRKRRKQQVFLVLWQYTLLKKTQHVTLCQKIQIGRQKILLHPASGTTLEWSSWTCRYCTDYKRIQQPAWQALDRYGQLKLCFSAHHLTSTSTSTSKNVVTLSNIPEAHWHTAVNDYITPLFSLNADYWVTCWMVPPIYMYSRSPVISWLPSGR